MCYNYWEDEYALFLEQEDMISDFNWEYTLPRFVEEARILDKGTRYTNRKTKRRKDHHGWTYKCDCTWCLDFKIHKHNRAMPIMETEEDRLGIESDIMDEWYGIPYEEEAVLPYEDDTWYMQELDWCEHCDTDLRDCCCAEGDWLGHYEDDY